MPYRLAIALYFIGLCSLSVARYLVYTKFRKNASTFFIFFKLFLIMLSMVSQNCRNYLLTKFKNCDNLEKIYSFTHNLGGLSINEHTIDQLQPCSERGNRRNRQNSALLSGQRTQDTQYLHRRLRHSLL